MHSSKGLGRLSLTRLGITYHACTALTQYINEVLSLNLSHGDRSSLVEQITKPWLMRCEVATLESLTKKGHSPQGIISAWATTGRQCQQGGDLSGDFAGFKNAPPFVNHLQTA